MALFINGTGQNSFAMNGVDIDNLYVDGVLVFTSGALPIAPNAPTNFTASDDEVNQITFTWDNSTIGTPTPTYDLYEFMGDGSPMVSDVTSPHTEPIPGDPGTITYYVQAVNSEGTADSNYDSGSSLIGYGPELAIDWQTGNWSDRDMFLVEKDGVTVKWTAGDYPVFDTSTGDSFIEMYQCEAGKTYRVQQTFSTNELTDISLQNIYNVDTASFYNISIPLNITGLNTIEYTFTATDNGTIRIYAMWRYGTCAAGQILELSEMSYREVLSAVIPPEDYTTVNVTMAELNAYNFGSISENTKFVVSDTANYTSQINVTPTSNGSKIWIIADNSLGVHMRGKLIISPDADGTIVEGLLFDGQYSQLDVRANDCHITRCRFDGINGVGHDLNSNEQWLIVRSLADANPANYGGQDVEISYCEFANFNPDYALTAVIIFSYLDSTHVQNHRIHHNLFDNFPLQSNGSEAISMYTATTAGSWSSRETGGTTSSTNKVYNNLFQDVVSDGEIVKGGMDDTHFYDNTLIGCKGTLSFRFGWRQEMYNCYSDAQGVANAGANAFSAPDCKSYNNIFLGIPSSGTEKGTLHNFESNDQYTGGFNMEFTNNYLEGGAYSLAFGNCHPTCYNVDKINATITDNTVVQTTGSKIVHYYTGADNSDITVKGGNEWYGSNFGDAMDGWTELGEAPTPPPYTPLTEIDVGINA